MSDKKIITLFSKQIHSGFSAAQTGDVFLRYEMEGFDQEVKPTEKHGMDFFELMRAVQQKGLGVMEPKVLKQSIIVMPGHFLDGEIVDEITFDPEYPQYRKIYLQADKTFYDKMKEGGRFIQSAANTPEFQALVEGYKSKGWGVWEFKNRSEAEKAFDKFLKDKELYKRSDEGLVLWNYGHDSFDPIQYNGGFSEQVYSHEDFRKYVERPAVFGWLGNTCSRKKEHDQQLEKSILKGLKLPIKDFVVWLTSSDGRHFAESLGGKSMTEQLQIIRRNKERIYNLALIYNDERHDGTWNGTERVRELLEKEGKLLVEPEILY